VSPALGKTLTPDQYRQPFSGTDAEIHIEQKDDSKTKRQEIWEI